MSFSLVFRVNSWIVLSDWSRNNDPRINTNHQRKNTNRMGSGGYNGGGISRGLMRIGRQPDHLAFVV